MSKFCSKCGTELEDNAVFCDECGAKQVEEQVAYSQQTQVQLNNGNDVIENKKQQSGFGIASFIFGILSIVTLGTFCFPEIIGIVFGITALKDKTKKHGLAKAGLIMSIIATVIVILMFVIIFALA